MFHSNCEDEREKKHKSERQFPCSSKNEKKKLPLFLGFFCYVALALHRQFKKKGKELAKKKPRREWLPPPLSLSLIRIHVAKKLACTAASGGFTSAAASSKMDRSAAA